MRKASIRRGPRARACAWTGFFRNRRRMQVRLRCPVGWDGGAAALRVAPDSQAPRGCLGLRCPAMSKDPDRAFFGHPRGLSTLFFTEMWERLSYYGGRTFLAIYMVTSVKLGGRGMSDGATGLVMALYMSSVYLLSLPGGWIADRFLGQRKAVTIGGFGIAIGNAMLALPV